MVYIVLCGAAVFLLSKLHLVNFINITCKSHNNQYLDDDQINDKCQHVLIYNDKKDVLTHHTARFGLYISTLKTNVHLPQAKVTLVPEN
jgi:hypothetical protein